MNFHKIVVPDFLRTEEIDQLLEISGTLEFKEGRATATEKAAEVKHNLQLQNISGHALQVISSILVQAIMRSSTIQTSILPVKVFTPIISKYEVGMYYGTHVDSPVMSDANSGLVRTDYAMTLFLSDPKVYDGGELCLMVEGEETKIKLDKGGAVFYPASYLHRVNEVSRGNRLAMVSWIQSLIPDYLNRSIVAEIKQLETELTLKGQTQEALTLLQIHSNLIKKWAML